MIDAILLTLWTAFLVVAVVGLFFESGPRPPIGRREEQYPATGYSARRFNAVLALVLVVGACGLCALSFTLADLMQP